MKALLVETDDYETLFLDGVKRDEGHKLSLINVLTLVLGKDSVETEYVFNTQHGEAYLDRIKQLEQGFAAVAEPPEVVMEAARAYQAAQREFKEIWKLVNANEDRTSSTYRRFSDACTKAGISVPLQSKGILDSLEGEANG